MGVNSIFQKVVKNLLIAILYFPVIIAFIALLILLTPVLIFRYLLNKYAQLFKSKELGKMLTARSSLMSLGSVYENPKNVILISIVVKGEPNIEQMRREVENKLVNSIDEKSGNLRFPELKQNIISWMGFLFWRPLKTKFNIEDHVYICHKDKLGQMVNTDGETDLIKFSKYLLNKNWSREKALWELIIIEDIQPVTKLRQSQLSSDQKCHVVCCKFHHSLMDGFSVLKFLQEIDQSGNMKQFLQTTAFVKTSLFEDILRLFKICVKAPYDIANSIVSNRKNDSQPLETLFASSSSNEKELNLKGECSRGVADLIPLEGLKTLKNNLGVGLTPLLSAAIVGAVRNFMKEKGTTKFPTDVKFQFPVPMKNHSEKFRNRMSFASIAVDLSINDPIKRLESITREFENIKTSTIPWTMAWLTVLGGCLPHMLLKPMIISAFKEQYIFLTNFPAPVQGFDLFGNRLVDGFFGASVAGTGGLVFALSTTEGDLSLAVGADKSILHSDDEANKLLDLCLEEIELFKKHSEYTEDKV